MFQIAVCALDSRAVVRGVLGFPSLGLPPGHLPLLFSFSPFFWTGLKVEIKHSHLIILV